MFLCSSTPTGSAMVLCAFPFIFMGCLGCAGAHEWAQVVYYAPFVVVFQFGWAATQISHLSLIPSITQDPNDRTELNAIRCVVVNFEEIGVGLEWDFFGYSPTRFLFIYVNCARLWLGLCCLFPMCYYVYCCMLFFFIIFRILSMYSMLALFYFTSLFSIIATGCMYFCFICS